jgi:predicted PurR-regulated permease PerM
MVGQRVWRSVRNPLWSAAALVIVVAGLKEAQSILLPVMVAVMLAIICSPVVGALEKRRIPTVIAVLFVVFGMMAVLAGLGALIGSAVTNFDEALPHYQARVGSMVESTRSWIARQGLEAQLAQAFGSVDIGSAAKRGMSFVGSSMNALATALSNTILVMLTMVLILMEGSTVPRKLRALSGDPTADIAHFNRIAVEVQRYLGIKTVLSLGTGLLVWLGAAILDVDFAVLWGLIAFLLNYIPNVGSILAAIPACLLALIQHGPGVALMFAAVFVGVNFVLGNVVEPMWMGRKLGLSTTVVFLSLLVWGWVWGPVGMLLSVPLTMIIKIMLEQSEHMSVVAVLLDSGDSEEAPPMSKKLRALLASEDEPDAPLSEAGPATPRVADPPDPERDGDDGDDDRENGDDEPQDAGIADEDTDNSG